MHQLDELAELYELEKRKNEDLQLGVNSVQTKIEREINRVKHECQQLLQKQEVEFL